MPIIEGTDRNDTLFPSDNIGNEIRGLAGDDTIFPGYGHDTLSGGDGTDLAYFDTTYNGQPIFGQGVNANLLDGDARAITSQGIRYYVLSEIENIYGGGGNDTLTGDHLANEIQGLTGDDELFGLGGDDLLFSGAGNDFVDAGAGDDDVYLDWGNATLDGGEGDDWLLFTTYRDGEPVITGGVNASLLTGVATTQNGAETYTYSFQNFEGIEGSYFDDQLTGDDNDNVLSVIEGNNTLSSLGGDDILYSGIGNDTLDGGDGHDQLLYFSSAHDSGLNINMTTGLTQGSVNGQAFTDQFTNIEEVEGTNFDDVLIGSSGNDFLFGHEGADTIKGGGGDDHYLGGYGFDIALFDGNSTQFTIKVDLAVSQVFIVDRTGAEGTDTGGTNLLRFADRDWDLVGDGQTYIDEADISAADFLELVELYIAYFDRAPDAEGLNFWTRALLNGTGLDQAADFFFDQPETRALYGQQMDTDAFVNAVYGNVLGRGPDDAGRLFWADAIDTGAVTQGQFIRSFLAGARAEPPADASSEFTKQQNADRAFLDSKTDIGLYYGALLGMSDVTTANDVMNLFDGSIESRTAAQLAVEAAYEDAVSTDGSGEMLIQVVGLVENPFGTDLS